MKKIQDTVLECRRQFMIGNKSNFIMALVAIAFYALTDTLVAFIFKNVIEAMEEANFKKIYFAMALGGVTALFGISGSYLEKIYTNRYIKKGISQFKKYVFTKLFDKSIGQFGDTSSSTFISAFSNDLNSIEGNYMQGTLSIINQIARLCFGVVAMLTLSWQIAIPVLCMTFLPAMIALRYGKRVVKKEKNASAENAGFVDQVKDLLSGFIVIKSFKAEKEVLQLFDKQNIVLEEAKRQRRQTSQNVSIISEATAVLITLMIVGLGTYFVFRNIMSIGTVFGFHQLQGNVMGPVKNLVSLHSNRKASSALIDKMADTIHCDDSLIGHEVIESLEDGIEIRDLYFEYEENKPVLKNISLNLEKGKSYAIVGNSGSGKSTLLSLLMGHSQSYNGQILYDNQELKNLNLDSLYDIVSVIQQNVFLFDSTLKDNITMFKSFDEDKYHQAISRAGLRELALERGDDYECGAGGSNLSGGEKQRVSIARCLLKETPVLMMDEATAALDNATAKAVSDAILSIDNLTRIIVTHKLEESTMRKYDEIIVLNHGVIVEKGKFDVLMDNKKYFYSLFNVSQE